MTDRLKELTNALIDLTGNRIEAGYVAITIESLIEEMIEEALSAYHQEKDND